MAWEVTQIQQGKQKLIRINMEKEEISTITKITTSTTNTTVNNMIQRIKINK